MLNCPGVNLDTSKMFMCGHSAGAWTTMLSTFGDQDIYKAALVFDPFNSDVDNKMGANDTYC